MSEVGNPARAGSARKGCVYSDLGLRGGGQVRRNTDYAAPRATAACAIHLSDRPLHFANTRTRTCTYAATRARTRRRQARVQ